ncbi:MAG: hypothetical protein GKC05_03185 [Methanomicrobiales archaeon]|nr:hypothetical protein [Methanomicrobiales archaeon]
MKCPVCGEDCVSEAQELIATVPSVFSPCSDCSSRILDKNLPPPVEGYREPCRCGKRFIDEVYAHLYAILVNEGIFSGEEPLKDVGTPLVHPGFAMKSPPYLPENSLVLLSRVAEKKVADRMVQDVPEIKAVVKFGTFTPGVVDPDLAVPPQSYELLAGCDIRANIFSSRAGPVVLYQQQSKIHIEFPRWSNPKIEAVEFHVSAVNPEWFVDAFCGIGKLGLIGARMGIPHVVMNDAWYAAAFWAAYNTQVNREFFRVDNVKILGDYRKMEEMPVIRKPRLIAETEGEQEIRVYQGDFRELHTILPPVPVLAALDIFEKRIPEASEKALEEWRKHVNGEAFIP